MSSITISYTALDNSTYQYTFDEFTNNELPRTYLSSSGFELAATGAAVLAGQPFASRYIWAISTVMTNEMAASLDGLYRKWDADRATGAVVAMGVLDQTFGTAVSTSALFSTPPSYERAGPNMMLVSFGMTEV